MAIVKKDKGNKNYEKLYIGAIELTWKIRWYKHKFSFNNRIYSNNTCQTMRH